MLVNKHTSAVKNYLGRPEVQAWRCQRQVAKPLLPNSSEKKTFTDLLNGNDTALSLSRGDHWSLTGCWASCQGCWLWCNRRSICRGLTQLELPAPNPLPPTPLPRVNLKHILIPAFRKLLSPDADTRIAANRKEAALVPSYCHRTKICLSMVMFTFSSGSSTLQRRR